ncbi:MAG: hypothetical protein U5K99_07185 [Anaerolineales bacterium]|nr:hypothetical protein [Anaerolineales bacterium]
MMKKGSGRIIWGLILIVLGVIFLLDQLGLIGNSIQAAVLGLMALSGLVFLYTYFRDDSRWWAAIPGLALLGLAFAGLESLGNFLPGSDWGGAVFLGLLGFAFWLIYLRGQVDWWAIIPGGVLVTLALVAGLDSMVRNDGALFFLGMGGTFALVGILPDRSQNTRWAFIPAGVLAVLGIFQLPLVGSVTPYLWPAALIIIGIVILIKNWR